MYENRLMKRFAVAAVALLCLSAASCFQSRHSLVRVCYPSNKLLRQAQTKYADHTPMTAAELRHVLKDDTSHYKILVVYSYCCSGCAEAMRDTYMPLMHSLDTSHCRMLFVLDDCGSLPWNADYLNRYGISTRYYMRDTDSLFLDYKDGKATNYQNWTNIANYITQPRRAFEYCQYAPLTLIVSPDGRVKQEYWQFDDIGFLTAYDLQEMVHRDSLSVYDLDFDRIDTTRFHYQFGADEIPSPDTTTFRHYSPRHKFCTPDGRCF